MRVFVAWSLLLLMLVGCSTGCGMSGVLTKPSPGYYSIKDEQEHKVTVKLMVTCIDGSQRGGSGFIVSKDTIITAKHVIDCSGQDPLIIIVSDMVGNDYFGIVDKLSSTVDAAKVKILGSTPFKVFAKIANNNATIGEELCIRSGYTNVKKCGYVNYLEENYIVSSLLVHPGDSGSPVFNEYGEVVGLVDMYGILHNGEQMGIFLNYQFWKDLVKE